jgi:hypothetical protein
MRTQILEGASGKRLSSNRFRVPMVTAQFELKEWRAARDMPVDSPRAGSLRLKASSGQVKFGCYLGLGDLESKLAVIRDADRSGWMAPSASRHQPKVSGA